MRYTIVTTTLLWMSWITSMAHADTYPRQAGVDAVHYVFRLTIGDQSNQIMGETTVNLRLLVDGVKEVFLDLASGSQGKGMIVTTVSSGGKPIAYSHVGDRLSIMLPVASVTGHDASFTIHYHGEPAGGLRLGMNMHGERTVFSENWPNKARQWLPMIDHPYDKATAEFIVTMPMQYQVVANGLLVEEVDLPDGQRRTHWKQSVPIASWLYALGAARFAVHHAGLVKNVPLQSWVFPQNREQGYALFEPTTKRALEFFSEQIGPYSYEKLANVQAAGMSGGMEHATVIFYGEKGVASGRGPVVHEVAHQWWGNCVTERDWDDVWLSEGFATYFTLLFTEHTQGRDAFVVGLKSSRTRIVQLEQKMPDTPVVHRNLSDMTRVLNQFVYQKGGWTLHMLRGLIGTESFWTGVRDYYRRFQNQNASTDEFRRVMEQASGKDLRWFFEQWLNRSGVPRLEGSWRYDATRKQVELTIAQTQTGEPFRLGLEIGVQTSSDVIPRIERFELTERRASFSFKADAEPSAVILDPETWLLFEAGAFTKSP